MEEEYAKWEDTVIKLHEVRKKPIKKQSQWKVKVQNVKGLNGKATCELNIKMKIEKSQMVIRKIEQMASPSKVGNMATALKMLRSGKN